MYAAAWGQTNFRAGYEKANPVPATSNLELEEKVRIHRAFLDNATLNRDTIQQLYAFIYLFTDYARVHDFTEAKRYLLQAETVSNASENMGWQGWVTHRRGILAVQMKDYDAAIEPYKMAASLCGKAGDSLCLGESLEQLGAIYGIKNDFEQAHYYYHHAIPIIEKYGSEATFSATASNFGGMLTREGKPAEAIPYFKQAISIQKKLGNQREEVQSWNNLGEAYYTLNQYNKALDIFNHCVQINTALNLPESLINNYSGLTKLYEVKGDLSNALKYLNKYIELKDSVVGAKISLQIAEMENSYTIQQKELELQQSSAQLNATQLKLERSRMFLLLIVLLAGFGLWRWRSQISAAQSQQLQSQENLNSLTKILLEKNTQLLELKEQSRELLEAKSSPETSEFDENLYSQRILTPADWESFKAYFERAYPSYLNRLREAFPSLTDAEKRVFLFIKLNLNTREAASILGISADSVKKTRYRLRQRLNLEQDQILDDFIKDF